STFARRRAPVTCAPTRMPGSGMGESRRIFGRRTSMRSTVLPRRYVSTIRRTVSTSGSSGMSLVEAAHPLGGAKGDLETGILVVRGADHAGHHIPGGELRRLVRCLVDALARTEQATAGLVRDLPGFA